MATAGGVALVLGVSSSSSSTFLSGCYPRNSLNPKRTYSALGGCRRKQSTAGSTTTRAAAWPLPDDLFLAVGVGLPCTVMECGDIIYRSTLPRSDGLTLTPPGIALALATVSYLWATPGVAPGFFDMFVLAFLERLFRPSFRKDDFVLGKKLGEGAFGVVYKVSLSNPKAASKPKQGDLVLKKATEYGAVEIWMNERVRRNLTMGASSMMTLAWGPGDSGRPSQRGGRGGYRVSGEANMERERGRHRNEGEEEDLVDDLNQEGGQEDGSEVAEGAVQLAGVVAADEVRIVAEATVQEEELPEAVPAEEGCEGEEGDDGSWTNRLKGICAGVEGGGRTERDVAAGRMRARATKAA